jgi:competence protein ComEC
MKNFSRLYYWIFGAVMIAGLLLGACLLSLPDGRLHVYVLDVGQGDSILIRAPTGEFILVDGGPDAAVVAQIDRVMPFYERRIDLMILSHPHADHVNGLVEVLKRYDVKQVMMTGVLYKFAGYLAFLEQINQQKIPVVFAGARNVGTNGAQDLNSVMGKQNSANNGSADYRLGNLFFDMIFPLQSLQGKTFENHNNGSIVFRLIYGQKVFYFTGDAELQEEEKILAARIGPDDELRPGSNAGLQPGSNNALRLDLRADFLKVGHHGSKTSSSEALLDRMKPLYASISDGLQNKFKHPHAETIEHLMARKIEILRTDLDGMIEAVSDGNDLQVRTLGK